MGLVIAILVIALCCVCVSWWYKENYVGVQNLTVENQCFRSLKYYEWQILKNKNLIIQELASTSSDVASPDYKKIEDALKQMKYFYGQRQKALDKYNQDKKELEGNGYNKLAEKE